MSPEFLILELLYWMRKHNLVPKKFHRDDRFLNPFTKKISCHDQMTDHQRAYSLWIPTRRGLRDLVPSLEMESVGAMVIAKDGLMIGAGPGESEALLSLMNDRRKALAAC